MTLAELRKQNNLTQKEAASLVGIPYRTYIRYEENPSYATKFNYRMIFSELAEKVKIDEENGVLSSERIKEIAAPLLKAKGISFCYLFGSYAKGTAKKTSDVDLLVDTEITGLAFLNLIEELRAALHKKVDLLRLGDLEQGNPIALEILREGIRLL